MQLSDRSSCSRIARASLSTLALAIALLVGLAGDARADQRQCRCLTIAADVPAAFAAEVARADALFARADFNGAFAIYARVWGSVKEPALLYAQAMAKWQLGATGDAKALLQAYLAAGGALAYRVSAEAGLRDLGGVAGGVVGGVGGITGGVVGGVGGVVGGVGGVTGGVVGGVGGAAVGGVDAGLGVAGRVTAKPKKIAGGAAVVLGVVAVAALGAVAIHSIAAGLKDDIELDAKFDLGLGLTGIAVGATAFYVGGLTVAAGAVGGAAGGLNCASAPSLPKHRPIVAPIALPGGGGIAGAMRF
jgi:hypothetical protein